MLKHQMRAIWRHQRRVAKELSSQSSQHIRPCPPALSAPWRSSVASAGSTRSLSSSRRCFEVVESTSTLSHKAHDLDSLRLQTHRLPLSCPGCGAPSQTIASEEAGYYNLTRSGIRNHVKEDVKEEDKVMDDVLNNVDKGVLSSLGLADRMRATSN